MPPLAVWNATTDVPNSAILVSSSPTKPSSFFGKRYPAERQGFGDEFEQSRYFLKTPCFERQRPRNYL